MKSTFTRLFAVSILLCSWITVAQTDMPELQEQLIQNLDQVLPIAQTITSNLISYINAPNSTTKRTIQNLMKQQDTLNETQTNLLDKVPQEQISQKIQTKLDAYHFQRGNHADLLEKVNFENDEVIDNDLPAYYKLGLYR